ncbi:hypothetical protein [uncultured Gammaproteobacteria bacterium]|uniref:DUF3108 domain-containing protein n=1 Tax=Bathymodiolus heckerae thiotrophic gill symbiont TaxID=1052212 RepID=UPI0010B0973A|nr:DUF3108 domain-containing protein [Bathymodiolus heckerae thiotrophic gill symbiont]CAC9543364.1 hypothetical protein [uncultured Gammaproteobacteria bacterium]CAC9594318.1 hypothetical protein [uncultured Gammaproteobacteria bacterium]CAC9596211.1 hypothetical protein [uncultured Gammaproteobacteria bacterium]CAC9598123.1 hypothetical protein [uncultured Gammaproteobacteria bacterium]CAC9956960.1 hypothetical protein [uncultured Gammaproteobacteria bacterium]
MKLGFTFTLLVLISASALAFKPHTAHYQLSVNGLKIAEEVRTLHQLEDKYFYTANAKTSDLVSLIKDYEINAKSTFILNQFGLHSTHYQYFERDGDQVKKNINIRLQDQQVDPLSLLLSFTDLLTKDSTKTDFYFMVNNGETVKKKHYQQVKSKLKNIIKIINLEDELEAYFDADQHYLPILIQRKNFTYQLQSVQFQP